MTQYNSANVNLLNLQHKLNWSNFRIASSSNDDTDFLHELLLTNTQVANFREVFANNLSANIKLSKTQISKITQQGRFLGRLLGS